MHRDALSSHSGLRAHAHQRVWCGVYPCARHCTHIHTLTAYIAQHPQTTSPVLTQRSAARDRRIARVDGAGFVCLFKQERIRKDVCVHTCACVLCGALEMRSACIATNALWYFTPLEMV